MEACRAWRIDFSTEALQRHILRQESGIVLLDGYSGCGKTWLLKGIKQLSARPVYLFSYRDVVDEIIRMIRMIRMRENCDHFLLEVAVESSVIGVEDVDYLYGKSAAQKLLADMIRIAADKHFVILTGNDVQVRTPLLYEICKPNMIVVSAMKNV